MDGGSSGRRLDLDDSIDGGDGSNDANFSRTLPITPISLPRRPVHGTLEMNEMCNFHVVDLSPSSLKKGGMY